MLAAAAALAAWPCSSAAQQRARIPTIGFLGANSAAVQRDWTAAFIHRLGELGWREGQEVRVEYRWAEGRRERSDALAEELARLDVDLILTHATPNVVAAKHATSTIPIVFAVAGDPVANGLVASLAAPGGNVTGLALQQAELVGKRLDLLRDVVGDLRRVAMLLNPANPNLLLEGREFQAVGNSGLIKAQLIEARSPEELTKILGDLSRDMQGLYVAQDPLFNVHKSQIVRAATAAGIPTVYSVREHVEAGGLMSYGPNFVDLFRRAADVVDKVLRGAKPADLPVQQPTKFDLVINLKTANAIGLTIPPSIIARADEVIE